MPQLSAEALVVSFEDADGASFRVLDGLDFAPSPGSLTAVVGASGSGKSTLLNALSGLIRPEAGRVMFDGIDVSRLGENQRDRWRRAHVGLIFQNFHLIEELDPRDNVMIAGWFDRVSTAGLTARADLLLETLGVPARRRNLHGLSRGEQQRVAIARAMMFDPPVILADEPTASLDRTAGHAVVTLLAQLAHRDGRTVVVVTHDADVMAAADAVVAVEHGRVAKPQAALA